MKKKWKIILSIVVLLLVVRLMLPFIIKKYVNKTLDDLNGYSGHLDDINLNLFRGAY